MADSPRNRRRTGSSSGSRRRVAGLRNRPTTRPGTSSEDPTAEVVGSYEEPTEVRGSQDDNESSSTQDAMASDRVESEEIAETEHESDTAVESDPVPSVDPASDAVSSTEGAEAAETDSAAKSTDSDGHPDSDDDQEDPETAEESAAQSAEPQSTKARAVMRRSLLPVMAVCTVVFAVLAVWFQYEANSLRNEGPASNDALVDNSTTSEVNGQISDAVEKLFSYDFSDTAKTEKAAKNLLVGGATKEYDQLFSTVKEQAPKQNLVVTTTVKSSGVTHLQGDRAEVLLFVDQEAVRTDSGKNNVGPAQITVGAEKHGDQWKINKIIQR